jgi:predicted O-methyltransferase YrrM
MSVLLHLIKWQFGLTPAEIWTTENERACLARHAAGKRRLVEVGVWHGGTTRHLRAVMSPEATLYAVDPFPKGRLGFSIPRFVARREVRQVPTGRVIWVRQTGEAAARMEMMREHPPIDFVFVDNAQTYDHLRVEWEAWAPVLGSGGIIALHDTRPGAAGMPPQTSEIYARDVVRKDARFTTVDEVDTLTVLQRLPR